MKHIKLEIIIFFICIILPCLSIKSVNYDSLQITVKEQILKEVESHIINNTRYSKQKYHKDIPYYIVEHGLNMNFNICFMMAQTQVETNYGTTGIGREQSKRSLFGFISHKYNSYSEAIIHYITIIKKNYLGDNKTEIELLKSYRTLGGHRYASDVNYENKLSKTYNYIIQNTNIKKLQELYYTYERHNR